MFIRKRSLFVFCLITSFFLAGFPLTTSHADTFRPVGSRSRSRPDSAFSRAAAMQSMRALRRFSRLPSSSFHTSPLAARCRS
jgi:hypothetical protein